MNQGKKYIKQNIKGAIVCLNNKFYSFRVRRVELKKMKDKRRIQLYKKVLYSKDEIKEIEEYYIKNYGKKIDLRWHKLYQSFTGKYDKKYIPEIIFSSELEPLLCKRTIASQLADKSMVELLYKSVDELYIPKTILLCTSGIYYNENREIISEKEAIKLIANCGKKIIKKIKDSCSGRGVLIIDVHNGYDKKII